MIFSLILFFFFYLIKISVIYLAFSFSIFSSHIPPIVATHLILGSTDLLQTGDLDRFHQRGEDVAAFASNLLQLFQCLC